MLHHELGIETKALAPGIHQSHVAHSYHHVDVAN